MKYLWATFRHYSELKKVAVSININVTKETKRQVGKRMDRLALSRLIGANIRKHRVQRDLSQEHLALESGIHPAYISKLERGEKCPTIDTLYRLAKSLGIPVYKLIDIDGDMDSISDTAYKIQKSISDLPPEKQNRVADLIDEIVNLIK